MGGTLGTDDGAFADAATIRVKDELFFPIVDN